uniref:Secreted protein n=1 Tax=Knipowitschia caucasica TaxID=637954 RepID=A0AAV2LAD7_KNICA
MMNKLTLSLAQRQSRLLLLVVLCCCTLCPQRKRARKRCTQDTSVQEPTRLELELEAYLQLHALKMSTSFALCVLSWIRGGN